jgi:hypothetical protein
MDFSNIVKSACKFLMFGNETSHRPAPSCAPPHLEPMLLKAKPGRRPRTVCLWAVLNAIFYGVTQGCSWQDLPGDFPGWEMMRTLLSPGGEALGIIQPSGGQVNGGYRLIRGEGGQTRIDVRRVAHH